MYIFWHVAVLDDPFFLFESLGERFLREQTDVSLAVTMYLLSSFTVIHILTVSQIPLTRSSSIKFHLQVLRSFTKYCESRNIFLMKSEFYGSEHYHRCTI
jgi:hypothetical protein